MPLEIQGVLLGLENPCQGSLVVLLDLQVPGRLAGLVAQEKL